MGVAREKRTLEVEGYCILGVFLGVVGICGGTSASGADVGSGVSGEAGAPWRVG